MDQLKAYCADKGYTYIDQVKDLDDFYGTWKDCKKGKSKKLERIKGFVRFRLKRKWLTENIAEDLKAPPKTSELNAKSPTSRRRSGEGRSASARHSVCDRKSAAGRMRSVTAAGAA